MLKNRWAILYFLMSVGEDSSSKHSHGQVHVMCIKLIMIQINSTIVNYFLSFFWIHYKKVILVVNCSYIELSNGTTQGFQKCRIFFYFVIYLFSGNDALFFGELCTKNPELCTNYTNCGIFCDMFE